MQVSIHFHVFDPKISIKEPVSAANLRITNIDVLQRLYSSRAAPSASGRRAAVVDFVEEVILSLDEAIGITMPRLITKWGMNASPMVVSSFKVTVRKW